jgi:cobalt-zinc-cadmium efflux system membrane fusion protein
VRVALATADARLKSGLFGSIELLGPGDARPLAVPVEAVTTLEGRQVVFVPADEPFAFRAVPVELGGRAGAFYALRSGLAEGAELVVRGAFTLKSAMSASELSEGHAH